MLYRTRGRKNIRPSREHPLTLYSLKRLPPSDVQWPPSVPEPTVNDARDAYETCAWIPNPDARSQCYSSMGVDGMRVEVRR